PAWRVGLAGRSEWALLPDTVSPDTDVLFVAGPNRFGARAVPDGRRLWDRDLGFTPGWVAQLPDSVVAAGPGGAARVALGTGRPVWQLRVPEPAPGFAAPPGWRGAPAADPAEL